MPKKFLDRPVCFFSPRKILERYKKVHSSYEFLQKSALFTVPRADDDVVVDDRLMMACNIYIFQFFQKKLF